MIARLSLILLLAASLSLRAAESDAQVDARKVAFDLAGAFSNDGFKIRDGHWTGEINKGEQALLAVNLYAGNQYWFSVGASDNAKKFAVQVYDENGKPVAIESYQDDQKAAAGFSPLVSGQYFVGIKPTGDQADTFCLVYSYK